MPEPTHGKWPIEELDRDLARACRVYQLAFNEAYGYAPRPLLTRLFSSKGSANCIVLFLPATRSGISTLDVIEWALCLYLEDLAEEPGHDVTERVFDAS